MESHADRTGERASRGGNTQKQDGEEEEAAVAAENRDTNPDSLKHRDPRPTASTRAAEEPPRPNFHIPRRNKENRALFQSLSSESREFAEILNIIISNYKDPSSRGNFVYSEPRLIHNEPLEKEFIEKRRELKQDGRTEKELAESFCFLLCDSNRVPLVCEKGLSVGSSWLNTLGHFTKGVYLCQYSDLLQANPHEPGSTNQIVIFKVIKGKVKSIYENKAKCLDPTPKFDSHFSKNATRVTSLQAFKAFEFTQQFFYEYVDFELASRPRHVCPYAVVSFQFRGKEAITVGAKPLPQQRCNSQSSGTGTESSGYTVWKGHFVNRSKDVYQANLRSPFHPFLPFKLPERIEIGKVMTLHQVKEVIPPAVFSWDVYIGSHEVFRNGMHCCLFEVVDKSKPGDSLAELFQKLEESELVLVTPMNDQGFLFLLSSGQMSNSSERWSGWKKSCLQALFAYRQSRDVPKSTSEATADRVPLTPQPEDPVMPKLDCFVPGLHNALNKIRSTFLASPNMAVEQQVCEYFSSLPESGHDLIARIEYDKKLDDKEKVFAAPRQRFNWESYMRPYMYSPSLFTIPVEKAKDMVESLGEIPKPDANPSTTDTAEDQSNVEKMMELIKVFQLNKNLKEAELMETQAVASHVYGQKRKLEEEVQEYTSKCLKLGNVECEVNLLNVLGVIGLQDTDLRTDRPQEVLKVVQFLDGLSKASMDVDLRKDRMQNVLISKMLEDLNKTLSGASTTNAEGAEEMNCDDVEISLQESLTKMGLPANCDTDLRERFVDDDEEEEQNKNPVVQEKADLEEETTNSLSSLEAFSPCSETNGLQRSHAPGERSIPWVLIPITGLKTERYSYRGDTSVDDPRFVQSPTVSTQTNPEKKGEPAPDRPESSNVEPEPESECTEDKELAPEPADVTVSNSLEQTAPDGMGDTPDRDVDSIVDEHISAFSTEVEEMLRGQHVSYVPYSGTEVPKTPAQMQILPFSEYVSHFNTPSHVQNYIDLFRDSVSAFIDPKEETWAGALLTSSSVSVTDALHQPAFTSTALSSASTSTISSSGLVHSEQQRASVPGLNMSTSDIQNSKCIDDLEHNAAGHAGCGLPKDSAVACGGRAVEAQSQLAVGENMSDSQEKNDCVTAEPPSAAISTLISQLRPEVINSLAKIIQDVQKNTSHFYIHCADEESNVCWEIKEYLLKLGNPECDPQTFLQKKDRNGKLLVVIQNIDIDAHIHKIPALVSLKKLPCVSFAGVDSLDDIKNYTYNELFVSGGFIVSDELVLNPDFISLERLQALLNYLEELNTPESPWRWRVHCKTHKKVKELSRSKIEALNVLSLLTTYHKKQIVEFLSYHECDSPLHQAPGLDCLVKLQAQHVRQRHVIFLTEQRFEMFPQYSSSGIVIANIDDILYSMASLIGGASDRPASLDLPSCPESPLEDDDVRTIGRMSSLEERSFGTTNQEPVASADSDSCDPDHPVRNPSDMAASSSATTNLPKDLDFEALKATIAHFREARLQAKSSSSSQSSPRPFDISTLQVLISQNDRTTSELTCEPASDPVDDLSSESRTTSQTEDNCSGTRDVPRASNLTTTSVKKNPIIPKTASNISTDPQPMWNKTSDPKRQDTLANLKRSGPSHEKNATDVNTTTNSSSSNTRLVDNANQNGGAGLLPVPGVYDFNNRFIGMDRMHLQNRSLWATSHGSFGLNGHGASSQNSALGLRSVANRLGVVTQSGLGGLLPNSHMQMAWNNLTQGTAVNMWGIQQGVRLGQLHRTPFIQGYTWHGNPPFQGSAHPPRRGGYDSW